MFALTGKESTEMKAVISGNGICLRFVTPDDADYIYGLRLDPTFNSHLSPISGTADDQRRWIGAYKAREAAGLEFITSSSVMTACDAAPFGCMISERIALLGEAGYWITTNRKSRA